MIIIIYDINFMSPYVAGRPECRPLTETTSSFSQKFHSNTIFCVLTYIFQIIQLFPDDTRTSLSYSDTGFLPSADTQIMGGCLVVYNGIVTVLGGQGRETDGSNRDAAVTRQVR